jgi:hypothetical protein
MYPAALGGLTVDLFLEAENRFAANFTLTYLESHQAHHPEGECHER